MSYFGIIHNADQPFEVSRCHLNLWSLPGFLGYRLYFWDVGLHIKAGPAQDLSTFSLALPFGTAEDGLTDLYDKVRTREVAELIFSRKVMVDRSSITLHHSDGSGDEWPTVRVSVEDSGRDPNRSGPSYSLWNIVLPSPITKGQECYLRIRFHVLRLGQTWIENYGHNSAVVDLRISDIRGAVDIERWRDLVDNMVPIENLYLFVIAPAWLLNRSTHPQLHYARLYEGRVWNTYLGRSPDRNFNEKLTIYEWRSTEGDEEDPIESDNPFRAFLALSREPSPILSIKNLAAALVVIIVAALVGPRLPNVVTFLPDFAGWVWTLIAGVGLGLAIQLIELVTRGVRSARSLPKRYHNFQLRRFQR